MQDVSIKKQKSEENNLIRQILKKQCFLRWQVIKVANKT